MSTRGVLEPAQPRELAVLPDLQVRDVGALGHVHGERRHVDQHVPRTLGLPPAPPELPLQLQESLLPGGARVHDAPDHPALKHDALPKPLNGPDRCVLFPEIQEAAPGADAPEKGLDLDRRAPLGAVPRVRGHKPQPDAFVHKAGEEVPNHQVEVGLAQGQLCELRNLFPVDQSDGDLAQLADLLQRADDDVYLVPHPPRDPVEGSKLRGP